MNEDLHCTQQNSFTGQYCNKKNLCWPVGRPGLWQVFPSCSSFLVFFFAAVAALLFTLGSAQGSYIFDPPPPFLPLLSPFPEPKPRFTLQDLKFDTNFARKRFEKSSSKGLVGVKMFWNVLQFPI